MGVRLGHAGPSGFTLIEMLVVIMIIALLISILLPSVKQAKRIARYTLCATQQKQIVQGLICYALENNNEFANATGPAPTVIGGALDLVHCIQAGGMISRDYQHHSREGDAALRVFTCPDFRQAAGRGHSIYDVYDRVVISWPNSQGVYVGWGPSGILDPTPGASAINTTYQYLGGIGNWSNITNGTTRWHGWNAFSQAMYDSYDDPYDGIGPILHMTHRRRHNEAAILTDRMWLTDEGNPHDPLRYGGSMVSGHYIGPNHIDGSQNTIGGNVGFPDGHIEWRWADHIEERIDTSSGLKPYICY